jgi:hypothetical protein
MHTPSISKPTVVIALLLAAVMAATRFHHFGSAMHLPDASLAIFLLAGFYLRPGMFFVAFLAEAALIDYLAITYAGVSDWCISPAYGFLLPTYACLWFAGRWYAPRHRHQWHTLAPLLVALSVGVSLAFAISNGSFYLLSGRFPDMGWTEYSARVMRFFPPYATSTFVYVLIAAALHAALTTLARSDTRPAASGVE